MFQLGRIEKLHDYFSACSRRREQAVFFYRVAGYSGEVAAFLTQYDQAARTNGVVIEGRIPNPDPKQLDYLAEMMGSDFQLDAGFLTQKLTRWLPRLTGVQREAVVTAMTATLQDLQAHGKNENMLRNAYIKYMCWLYYKFERILGRLGGDELPKILYDGTVSSYELQLLVILARAGADIVLLERAGDEGYLRCDPTSQYAQLYQAPGLTPFPADFSLRQLREQGRQQAERQKLYGAPAGIAPCTNAWMKAPDVKEILTAVRARGRPQIILQRLCRAVRRGGQIALPQRHGGVLPTAQAGGEKGLPGKWQTAAPHPGGDRRRPAAEPPDRRAAGGRLGRKSAIPQQPAAANADAAGLPGRGPGGRQGRGRKPQPLAE